jgi:hypothetical protein
MGETRKLVAILAADVVSCWSFPPSSPQWNAPSQSRS